MFLLTIMLTVSFILIGVAFLTLMEQKVLSYIQVRKSPNKVGMLQPISEPIKLFFKNMFL